MNITLRKLSFLLCFLCFAGNALAQSHVTSANDLYTFETIAVEGVDYLAVGASSDFEDYAGNTPSPDGERMIGFTLIDGVFKTYDFPGAKNIYFYALGNNGVAGGYYEDSDGLHHGVIVENGEMKRYDFPGAVETFIFGYSDSKGIFTGSFIDESGLRKGFSGDIVIEFPRARATYADFVNAEGRIVGSFIDEDGLYRSYYRSPDGRVAILEYFKPETLEYFFVHGITDSSSLMVLCRAKQVGDVPRTYIGSFIRGLKELNFPGSVSTEGWNINQDNSVVGHYDTEDGRRHGFIAKRIR